MVPSTLNAMHAIPLTNRFVSEERKHRRMRALRDRFPLPHFEIMPNHNYLLKHSHLLGAASGPDSALCKSVVYPSF
jgi:hypothetical protein